MGSFLKLASAVIKFVSLILGLDKIAEAVEKSAKAPKAGRPPPQAANQIQTFQKTNSLEQPAQNNFSSSPETQSEATSQPQSNHWRDMETARREQASIQTEFQKF